jgi:hypothetical protein
MALVDYSSGESSDAEQDSRQTKRQKIALPPLPATFHDLYASSVRHSTTDDPTLHQGRTRQIPHVAGNWPSHLYIEWHPSVSESGLLTAFITDLQHSLGDKARLSSFLVSDLGNPQPLHISLSRPFVLSTAEKDEFLGKITHAIEGCRVAPFSLQCRGVEWHRTEESSRSFLVLRVQTGSSRPATRSRTESDTSGGGVNPNPELTKLLKQCNSAVKAFGQQELYQWATDPSASGNVGDAFHISIAWCFEAPDENIRQQTENLFASASAGPAVKAIHIEVDGIKVKIGNVVSHIPLSLPGKGHRDKTQAAGSLFGI